MGGVLTCLGSSGISRSSGFLNEPESWSVVNLRFRSIFDWDWSYLAGWTIFIDTVSHFFWGFRNGPSSIELLCSSVRCRIFRWVLWGCCLPLWDWEYVIGPFVVSVCHVLLYMYKRLMTKTFYFCFLINSNQNSNKINLHIIYIAFRKWTFIQKK